MEENKSKLSMSTVNHTTANIKLLLKNKQSRI